MFKLLALVAAALMAQQAAADPTSSTGLQYTCAQHPSFAQTYSPPTTCGTYGGAAYLNGWSDFYKQSSYFAMNCKYVGGGSCYFYFHLNTNSWTGDAGNNALCVIPSAQNPAQPSGGFVNKRRDTPAWLSKRASTDPNFPWSCPLQAPGYSFTEAIMAANGYNNLAYTYYCSYNTINCFYDANGLPTSISSDCPSTLCNTGSDTFRRRDAPAIASRQVKAADLRRRGADAGAKGKQFKR